MQQFPLVCILLIFLTSWTFSPSMHQGMMVAEANWLANIPRIFFRRKPTEMAVKQQELESSIQTLKEEIFQLKRQLVVYKQNANSMRKGKIELKQQYDKMLRELEQKHQEELFKVKSSINDQYKVNTDELIQQLRDDFELEKQELLLELEKLHKEEKDELKKEILALKSSSHEATQTIGDLKQQLKVSKDNQDSKLKEYENKEGDFVKTVAELKEQLAKSLQPPTTPVVVKEEPSAPLPSPPAASPVTSTTASSSSKREKEKLPSHRRSRSAINTSTNPPYVNPTPRKSK